MQQFGGFRHAVNDHDLFKTIACNFIASGFQQVPHNPFWQGKAAGLVPCFIYLPIKKIRKTTAYSFLVRAHTHVPLSGRCPWVRAAMFSKMPMGRMQVESDNRKAAGQSLAVSSSQRLGMCCASVMLAKSNASSTGNMT